MSGVRVETESETGGGGGTRKTALAIRPTPYALRACELWRLRASHENITPVLRAL